MLSQPCSRTPEDDRLLLLARAARVFPQVHPLELSRRIDSGALDFAVIAEAGGLGVLENVIDQVIGEFLRGDQCRNIFGARLGKSVNQAVIALYSEAGVPQAFPSRFRMKPPEIAHDIEQHAADADDDQLVRLSFGLDFVRGLCATEFQLLHHAIEARARRAAPQGVAA